MKTRSLLACQLVLGGLIVLLGGCGKKESDSGVPAAAVEPGSPNAPQSASGLREAEAVLTAVNSKDYDGAIRLWAAVQQAARTPELRSQFDILSDELRIKLLEAAPTDPKAHEAMLAFRRMTGGR